MQHEILSFYFMPGAWVEKDNIKTISEWKEMRQKLLLQMNIQWNHVWIATGKPQPVHQQNIWQW